MISSVRCYHKAFQSGGIKIPQHAGDGERGRGGGRQRGYRERGEEWMSAEREWMQGTKGGGTEWERKEREEAGEELRQEGGRVLRKKNEEKVI